MSSIDKITYNFILINLDYWFANYFGQGKFSSVNDQHWFLHPMYLQSIRVSTWYSNLRVRFGHSNMAWNNLLPVYLGAEISRNNPSGIYLSSIIDLIVTDSGRVKTLFLLFFISLFLKMVSTLIAHGTPVSLWFIR